MCSNPPSALRAWEAVSILLFYSTMQRWKATWWACFGILHHWEHLYRNLTGKKNECSVYFSSKKLVWKLPKGQYNETDIFTPHKKWTRKLQPGHFLWLLENIAPCLLVASLHTNVFNGIMARGAGWVVILPTRAISKKNPNAKHRATKEALLHRRWVTICVVSSTLPHGSSKR